MKNTLLNGVPSFEYMFHRDMTIFRYMGMSSMSGIFIDQEFKSRWWEICPLIISIVILFFTMACQMISMWPISSEQLEYILELFPFTLSNSVSTIKIVRLFTYRSEFYYFIRKIREMWNSARNSKSLTEPIVKLAEHTRLMTSYYTMLIAFVCLTHLIYPYLFIFKYQLQKEMNSSYDFSGTVFPCNYPFQIKSYLDYFMLITYEQFDVVIACTAWASCDTLFAQLTTHVALQFMVIAHDATETINNNGESKNAHQVANKLKNIAEKYQQLFLLCDSIEAFFSPVIFVTVVSNAVNLCCGIYRLDQEITAGNWNAVATNAVYITSVSLQTVVFCIFAERLTESSTMINKAIYHAQWIDYDRKLKMMMLTMMIRAQKQFTCTAYSIIDVNYDQLKQIANATVSYFMLLRSL